MDFIVLHVNLYIQYTHSHIKNELRIAKTCDLVTKTCNLVRHAIDCWWLRKLTEDWKLNYAVIMNCFKSI
jgi:hypothetical protein